MLLQDGRSMSMPAMDGGTEKAKESLFFSFHCLFSLSKAV
jgi:hypothetical protein